WRAGVRPGPVRAPAVLAGQRGGVRVGRAGRVRGGHLRAARDRPAAAAPPAVLAGRGGGPPSGRRRAVLLLRAPGRPPSAPPPAVLAGRGGGLVGPGRGDAGPVAL